MSIRLPAVFCLVVATAAMAPARAQYTEPVLGRLFTAPDERTRIDRDRASAPAGGVTAAEPVAQAVAPPAADTPAPPPAPMRFTGVVRRSDGHATVWIDDEPRETTLGRYRPGRPITVDTPAGRVLAKPGDQIDPNHGAPRTAR